MPSKTITNPTGAFGYTDLTTQDYAETAAFLANSTITGPAVVSITTTGNSVATSATNGTASLAVGIAVQSITSGQVGLVVVQGMAENVPVNGAVAAGDLLKPSATTAGRVATTATPAAGEVIGVAINASSGGTVDVWVTGGKALS
jgi:hypothetical protein